MKYTLAFDVYGTLIDTSGVLYLLQSMVGEKAESLMHTWRNKQLEYSFRRGLMNRYADFSVCTLDALVYSSRLHEASLDQKQQNTLMEEYGTLPVFPDVESSLISLRADGHKIYAFSNGSYAALDSLLTNAKIINLFDGVVSVEDIRTFKPNPLVYAHFNAKTNSTKADSWLISSNSFDVIGAVSYGMRSVWVEREIKVVFDPWDVGPTRIVGELTELAAIFFDSERTP